jgi:hypothetical protein
MKITSFLASPIGDLMLVFALLLNFSAAASAATTAVWDGGIGKWTDSGHWSTNPLFPSNGAGNTYQASMGGGSLALDRDIVVDGFSISGGTFIADHNLSLSTSFESTGGTTTFAAGASLSTPLLRISGGAVNFNSNLVLPSTDLSGDISSGATLGGNGDFTIGEAFTWSGGKMAGTGKATFVGNHVVVSAPESLRSERKIINNGTFDWLASGPSAYIILSKGATFTNTADAVFVIHGSFRTDSIGHSTQEYFDNAGVFRQDAPNNFSGILLPFRNSGIVEAPNGTLSFSGGYRQTAGITNLKGITFGSGLGPRNVIFDGGTVLGSTTIDPPTFSAAVVSIGAPIGEIRVTDLLTLLNGSRLMFDIGGLTRISKYDSLYADKIDLGGILDVRLANGFESFVQPGDAFSIITTQSVPTGNFTNLSDGRIFTSDGLGSFRVTINSSGVMLDDFRPIPEPLSVLSPAAMAAIFLTRRRFQ